MLPRTRDESGAFAVVYALLALVLLGVSALAIDVGHVYAKRSALQSNVDLAVLAAAAELDSGGACNAEVTATAIEYLEMDTNEVPDQVTLDLGGSAGDGDGFIRCHDWRVELGGSHGTCGLRIGPCRHGRGDCRRGRGCPGLRGGSDQVPQPDRHPADVRRLRLRHRRTGTDRPAAGTCPRLRCARNDSGGRRRPSAGPRRHPERRGQRRDHAVPGRGDRRGEGRERMDSAGGLLQREWRQLRGCRDGHCAQHDAVVATSLSASPSPPSPPRCLPPTACGGSEFSSRVRPASSGGPGTTDSAAFTVGDLLFCDGMVSGNFGTLRLARNDVPNGAWIEMNIIRGVMPHLAVNASSVVPCSPVDSDHAPVSPTDCVSTDPGFPNEAATDGFVNGSGSTPGRLDADTTPGCDRNGGDDRTSDSPNLNDDLLSCYILGGHSVGDVAGRGGQHPLGGHLRLAALLLHPSHSRRGGARSLRRLPDHLLPTGLHHQRVDGSHGHCAGCNLRTQRSDVPCRPHRADQRRALSRVRPS